MTYNPISPERRRFQKFRVPDWVYVAAGILSLTAVAAVFILTVFIIMEWLYTERPLMDIVQALIDKAGRMRLR